MEKCKFCQAELEEGVTLCPACGKDNAQEAAAAEETAPVAEEAAVEESAEKVETEVSEEPAAETEKAAPAEETPAKEPVEIKPGVQATPGKIALAVAAIVVLVAALAALVMSGLGSKTPAAETVETGAETAAVTEAVETTPATVPADGDPEDVTAKGTYTVTDEEALAAKAEVVATVGEKQLTNGVLQVYYWRAVQDFLNNYGAYASYFGMDYTKPLDTQLAMDQSMTWQQYFLMVGLNNWHQVQAMTLEAENAGVGISEEDQEYLDTIKDTLEDTAASYSMTLEELLKNNVGPGAGFDEFMQYQMDYCSGVPYYLTLTEALVPTEQDLEDYFAAHEADYTANSITKDSLFVNVRHILVTPEGGTVGEDGTTTYSDEEWKACEDKAQEILDQWLAGEKTEDSFAALANEHSTDPGSNTNGGLYEDVYAGQMVQAFNDWCFDTARVTGDSGVVRTEYGCHVMYFVSSRPQWKQYAQEDWTTEQTTALLEGIMSSHPIEVSYEKIVLGLVEIA